MFGTLRFFLSMAVFIGHMHFLPYDLSPFAASAVVIFYVLSGYAVANSYIKSCNQNLYIFYRDRILRIFPLYIFFLIATLLVNWLYFEETPKNLGLLIPQLMLVPLNFYYDTLLLIPQSWSLGTEAQFYLLLPLILYFRPVGKFLFVISFAIFCLAMFGEIETLVFGYYLLPGVLFMFLSGIYLCISREKISVQQFIWVNIIVCSLLMMKLATLEDLTMIKAAIIGGYLLGLVIIYFIGKNVRRHWLDDLMGNLSYPIFLSHFLVILTFEKLSTALEIPWGVMSVILLILVIAMSYAAYLFIDKHISNWRASLKFGMKPSEGGFEK